MDILYAVISMIFFFAIAKWYRYITRYEIGYFAIAIPAVLLYFQKLGEHYKNNGNNEGKALTDGICYTSVFLCILTLEVMLKLYVPYIIPSEDKFGEYFRDRSVLYSDHYETAEYVINQGYKDIGFMCGNDSYEYPIFKMMEGNIDSFQHVNVNNETGKYEDKQYQPDCIIVVDQEPGETVACNGMDYRLEKQVGDVLVYIK